MGFFDDLAQAGVGFTRQFGGLGYDAAWAQLRPWLGSLSTNGVLRWLPKAASGTPCSVPEYEGGVPVGPCEYVALESCLGCGRPTCLNHSFVDSQGDAICYICAVNLRKQGSALPKQPPPQTPFTPPGPDPVAVRLTWARTTLNVQEGTPWPEVRKQYRALSAQFHPDRPSGNEARFKDVQMAYDVLKTSYGEN